MRRIQKQTLLTRRSFLGKGVCAAGLAGLAGASLRRSDGAASRANPFAYDLSRLARTDPKLIHYEQVGTIRCPREEPRRLAIGPDNRFYVACGKYITRLDGEGGVLNEIALPSPARCLAVTPEGEVFAGLRDHIEVFDRPGKRRAAWDSAGARAWLTGLVVTGDEVFAADAGQRVILRYDRAGKLLERLGEKNKERNIPGFIVPSPFFDLELARDGLLRVTNPGRHRVEAYTTAGDFEFAWGRASAAVDGFCGCCNPISLALLPDGRHVTGEKGLPRVKVYSAEGEFESVVAGPESFPENAKVSAGESVSDTTRGGLDVAVDAQGRVCILDLVTADIRIMARKAGAPS